MKKYLLVVLLGVLNGILPLLLLLLTEIDFRYFFLLALIMFFFSSYISGQKKLNPVLVVLILSIPLITGFSILILRQIFSLATIIIPLLVVLLAGIFWTNIRRVYWKTIAVISILFIALFVSFQFIPRLLTSLFSREVKEPSPVFEISDTDGRIVSSNEFKGKTLVVDFFGFWCSPCFQELPELQKVKEHYKNIDIVFLVVNTDQTGNFQENLKKFKIKHNLDFNFYYDCNGKALKLLGLRDVPSLVIIDKRGIIRIKRTGYNKSEGNFKSFMINFIDRIR
jgi:peroxiredoxin